MTATIHHIWLLLTLRHRLDGLPHRSFSLICMLYSASAIVAAVRWWSPMVFAAHLLVLCLIARLASLRVASAYALISIGIDVLAMPVQIVTGDRGGFFPFGAWETLAMCTILLREERP